MDLKIQIVFILTIGLIAPSPSLTFPQGGQDPSKVQIKIVNGGGSGSGGGYRPIDNGNSGGYSPINGGNTNGGGIGEISRPINEGGGGYSPIGSGSSGNYQPGSSGLGQNNHG